MGSSNSKEEEQIRAQKEEIDQLQRKRDEDLRCMRGEQQQLMILKQKELEYKNLQKQEQEAQLRRMEEEKQREFQILEQRMKQLEKQKQAELDDMMEKMRQIEAEKQAEIDRKLAEPWTSFEKGGEWSESYEKKLIDRITRHEHYGEVKSARILFLGPIRAGKSSFINSIASIDKGRLATPMLAGAATRSMSQKLKQYKPKNILQNFILLDTMGVEEQEGEGFNVQDILYLIRGNVKPNYKFNPRCPIDTSDENNFKKEPTIDDQPHCIVVVMDSCVIDTDSISEEAQKKIRALQQHVHQNDVPTVLVLTKIDLLWDEISNDITTAFSSRKLRDVVDKAEKIFGINKKEIFPVRCYFKEREPDFKTNILILLALVKMMEMASDRLESMADQEESD